MNMGASMGSASQGQRPGRVFCRWRRLGPVFRPVDRKRLRMMEGEGLRVIRSKILEKK